VRATRRRGAARGRSGADQEPDRRADRRARCADQPHRDLIGAARALGGTTVYDEALDPEACAQALREHGFASALLVGADWALVDPALCDAVIERHAENPKAYPLTFTQAPPGLAGAVVSLELLEDFVKGGARDVPFATIGGALGYVPTNPRPDPIAKPCCVQIDAELRQTCARFIPDSPARLRELESLLGGRSDLDAVEIARLARAHEGDPDAPRELTLTLPMDGADARRIVDELAEHRSDGLLTLRGGTDDALAHPIALGLVTHAKPRGLRVHVRTTLRAAAFDAATLVASGVDVISIDLFAVNGATYRRLTGEDAFGTALERMEALLGAREVVGGLPRPWVVPRITRCDAVYEEIEAFFDKWTMLAGCALIDQLCAPIPGDRIEPLGKPRAVLRRDATRRMLVRPDGAVVANEREGTEVVAKISECSLKDTWRALTERRYGAIRAGDWDDASLRTGW